MFESITTGWGQILLAPDPVNPNQGADQLAGLRELAGQFLTGCIVLVVISAIVSVTLFVIGKMTALSNAQEKSLMWSGRVFLGAAIIGSIGGLIFWGSGLGKFELMPAGAQQPTVEITKKPAKTTCINEIQQKDPTKVEGLVEALLSDEDAAKYKDGVVSVLYTPAGPDCTSDNTTPDACKQVTVSANERISGDVYAPKSNKYDPRNTSECKN